MTPHEEMTFIMSRYADTDKHTHHSYDEVYAELLAPYRKQPIKLLEVGVRMGGSLKTWRDWFDQGEIWGLDNGLEAGFWNPDDPRIHVAVADSMKPETLALFVSELLDDFDIIIDDGCHHPYVQVATWAALWPSVKPGGIYVIEDIEDISYAKTMEKVFGCEVIDRRKVKGRHDDILAVWRKP